MFINRCIRLCCDDGSDNESDFDQRPLLDRTPPSTMPRARVYGKRKQTDTSASTIFGIASSPNQQAPASPAREPLDELAKSLKDLSIRGQENERPGKPKPRCRLEITHQPPQQNRRQRSQLEQKHISNDTQPNRSSPRPQRSQLQHLSPTRDHELRVSTPDRQARTEGNRKQLAKDDGPTPSPSTRVLRSQQKQIRAGGDKAPSNLASPLALRTKQKGKQPTRSLKKVESTSSENISSTSSSDNVHAPGLSTTKYTPDQVALLPLIRSYKTDCHRPLPIEKWTDILPAGSGISKIAEASYAEVYRVSINGSESILKVMQLKMPSDKDSLECRTASDPSQVVSEIRIMNLLTEYPGFVTFKAAHLIRGKPCTSLIRARNANHDFKPAAGLSIFPDPTTFTEKSVSLVVELGDAGQCLDSISITTIDQLWDVILGIVVTLTAAEVFAQFEHRDLHESNICVLFKEPTNTDRSANSPKYGRSGIEVTILDYGLSRATFTDGDVVYNDLEKDLEIFRGGARTQYDTYRRMRTHLFTGNHSMYPKNWHTEESKRWNNGRAWDEFIPYTNVLWIKYILGYLVQEFKKHGINQAELAQFTAETKDLKTRLNPKTLVANGAFMSATEVGEYVVEKGWVSKNTILAEADSAIDVENEGVEDEE